MITYLGNVLNRLPEWDTLFGVANLEDAPVTARFRFWNEGWELPAMRFMKDTELAWLDGRAYVGDL